ncbi:MAG: class II fructose-bisphosphate aldolase [Planctomycetia bacterium]|nr:class II fructose-bisphosphate aldolase [Planctomycetia bacterium]
MLVNLNEVLKIAESKKFAVPAFNVYNMETAMGIFQAAEELRAPVIVQSYSRLFASGAAFYLAPSVLKGAEKVSVPVCFHLDHGAGEMEVQRALRYGCTGIMVDCSALPLEENIAATKRYAEICDYVGVPVEGELGHIGTTKESEMAEYTKVDEAVRFAAETKVAALAILVGTAHGRYKKAPHVDVQRIADIHAATDTPLVLHGGSGIPDDQVRESIQAGIRKVNFGTDICYSFLDKVFETSRDLVAVDIFMRDAIENVKKFAMEKIRLLDAEGKV